MVRNTAKKSGGFLSNKSSKSTVKKDFEKKKLKVGKGKVVPRNQTNVDQFRAKRVILARQSILEDKSGASAKLRAILSQVRHYNVFKRRDALVALKNFCFAEDYKEGESHDHRLTSVIEAAAKVFDTVAPCMCDADGDVRRLASEFLTSLFSALPYQDIRPFARLLCAQIRAGITHVDSEIRADASAFLAWILSQSDNASKDVLMPPVEASKLASAFLSSQKVTVHNLESVALLLMRAADGSASSSLDAGSGCRRAPFTLAGYFGATSEGHHNTHSSVLSPDVAGKLSKQLLNLWLDTSNAGLARSPIELARRRLFIAQSTNAALTIGWLSSPQCGPLVEAILKEFPCRVPPTSSDRGLYEVMDELNYAKGQLLESKEELSPKEQKLVVTFLVSQAERIASSNAAKKSSDIREVPALRPWMSLATKALQPSRKVGHLRQLTRANALVRRGLWRLAGLDVEEEDDDEGYTSTESKEDIPDRRARPRKSPAAKATGGAFAVLAEDSDDESVEETDDEVDNDEGETSAVDKKGTPRRNPGQLAKVVSVTDSKIYPVSPESPLFLHILPTIAAMCSSAVEEPPLPLHDYQLSSICTRVVSESMRAAVLRRLPRLAWHLSCHGPAGPELLYVLSVIGQLTAVSPQPKEEFAPIQALLLPIYCGVRGAEAPLGKMGCDSQMVAVALLNCYSKLPKTMVESLSKLAENGLADQPSELLKLMLKKRC